MPNWPRHTRHISRAGLSRRFIPLQLAALALTLLLAACAVSAPPTTMPAFHEHVARATPSPASPPTATPGAIASSGLTGTLPPGSPLPSEATCAARIQRSSWEPRPENHTANMRAPTAAQIAGIGPWGTAMGLAPQADALRRQITGAFTGTTDEILQWVACKWGFDPDIVRAQAVVESSWRQSQRGDYTTNRQYCPQGAWDGAGCYQSYGLLQIKWYYFKGAWPMSRTDSAFNAEYVYGILRACYEGWTPYLKDGTPLPGYPRYHAGDLWGCLGRWYSGWWYTQDAVDYIAKVKTALSQKAWLAPGF